MKQGKPRGKTGVSKGVLPKEARMGELLESLSVRLNIVLDELLTPVVMIDKNLSIVFANRAALSLKLISDNNLCSALPGIEEVIKNFISKDSKSEVFNEMMVKIGNEVCYMKLKISRIRKGYFLLCLKDVTKEISLISQLRHSQKMGAIGQLTSGIAHDFNNILTVIGGYADIIRKKMSDEQLKKYLDQIYVSAEKGTALIRDMLAFSRKNDTEFLICNLHQLVNSAASMFDRMLNDQIKVIVIPCKQNLYVMADSVQLEQVIMNLLTNAQDAMPNGGSISITLGVANAEDIDISSVYAKEYAIIKVEDCGHGMDTQVMEQIFTPFFTTKPSYKGTGLGLAMVNEIVKNHKGKVACSSVVNEGTIFYIYLPLLNVAKI